MATYRYLFADLITNQVIAELPLTGVTYSQELNNAGSFTGHLLLTDARESAAEILSATQPGRTVVYIDRNDKIVWGGILWTRDYTNSSQTITFGGREFESYWEHRILQKTGSPNYASAWLYSVDIFTMIQNVINTAHSYNPGTGSTVQSNPGIIIPTNTLGQTIGSSDADNLVIGDWQFRTVFDIISQYSKQAKPKGFDFNVDVAYDSSYNIVKTLEMTAQRGTPYLATSPGALMLELPGNMVDYDYPEDGSNLATIVYGRGSGSNQGQIWWNNYQLNDPVNFASTYTPSLRSVATDKLADNFPVYEVTTDTANEVAPSVVGSMASAQLLAKQQPVVVMKCVWDGNIYTNYGTGVEVAQDPELGSFKTGDQFRIRINDVRFPNQYDEILRLSKYDVVVGETGPERITGYFVNPNAF